MLKFLASRATVLTRRNNAALYSKVHRRLHLDSVSSVHDEPAVLVLKDGTTIPYPPGCDREINPDSVSAYGLQAVSVFLPEISQLDKLRNLAQLRYREMRDRLLRDWPGRWVAVTPVSSKGDFIVGFSELQVRKAAEIMFPFRVEEYHADCVGCEVLTQAIMDSSSSTEAVPEFDLPSDVCSGLSGTKKNDFVIRVEHSFDGQKFNTHIMKHDSGAVMMGAPRDILLNPPAGYVAERGANRHYVAPDGRRHLARVYKNQYIRVCGVIVQTEIVESRVWLLGFPVLSRFRSILDVKAKEPVVLEPLPTS